MTDLHLRNVLSVGVFAFGAAVPAVAQAETTFTLGAAAGVTPDYVGSDDYEFSGLPVIGVEWESDEPSEQGLDFDLHRVELNTFDGLQVEALRFQEGNHRFSLVTGIGANLGRDEDDNDALQGLGDIDPHAIGNITLEYGPATPAQPHFVTGALSLDGDLTGETDSITIDGEVRLNHAVVENLIISHGPNLTWGNDDHMQSYFGVDSAQALTSNFAEFNAESGLQDIGYTVSGQYQFNDNVGLFAQGEYSRLLADAADSPLVDQEGSANQFTFFTGIAYRF